jgi:hypothetical protein
MDLTQLTGLSHTSILDVNIPGGRRAFPKHFIHEFLVRAKIHARLQSLIPTVLSHILTILAHNLMA